MKLITSFHIKNLRMYSMISKILLMKNQITIFSGFYSVLHILFRLLTQSLNS